MMLLDTHQPRADALVLFGATGDLAKRKLFPALYQLAARRRVELPVVAVSRSAWSDEELRKFLRGAEEAVTRTVSQLPTHQRLLGKANTGTARKAMVAARGGVK